MDRETQVCTLMDDKAAHLRRLLFAAMFACNLPLSVDIHRGLNAEAEAGLGVC